MSTHVIGASALVKPGEFTFLCSFPGRFGPGVNGQWIVK